MPWPAYILIAAALLAVSPSATEAAPPKSRVQSFTAEDVDKADFAPGALQRSEPSPLALKVQVFLDRAHVSPGAIDGVYGASTIQAIRSFQLMHGFEQTGELTPDAWAKLRDLGGPAPVLTTYKVRKEDVKGPFADRIPDDYEDKAKLKRLAYVSAAEGLAEKFHMDEGFLKALNADKDLDQARETITVVDTGPAADHTVERVEIDGRENVLRAYGPDNRIVAAYPATIGSKDTPSPSGSLKVRAIANNPAYTYDPAKLNFKEVDVKEKLTIAPGPNNPVGSVWIDLDKETYGIHGTPDPADIGKESSHGCVRLTNWDAKELAKSVKQDTPVEFVNVLAAQ